MSDVQAPGREHPGLQDVVLAAGSFILVTVPLLTGAVDGQGPTAAIAVLGLLTAAPLILRRTAPVPVLAAVCLVLMAAALSDVRFTPWVSNAGPALGIATLTVGERLPRRTAIRAGATAIAAVTVCDLVSAAIYPQTDQDAVQLLIGTAGLLVGMVLRTRRNYERELLAERRQRDAEAERRIRAEERLRVSADVHDIVSHALSMIAVRSGVARMVLDRRPQEALEALSAIETTSRGALDELRAVLHALRDDAVPDSTPNSRAPTLTDVPALVETLRAQGYPLILHRQDAVDVAPLVEESAYRVVQESLTNVVKHAGEARTTVEIGVADGCLVVSVVNSPGAGRAEQVTAGFGLTGMRERVGLHGGSLEAGPTPDGGFAVRAVLPAGRTTGGREG